MPDDVDVTSLRALAHPLRLRLLDLLRFDGPATATMLAKRVGESSGSTSYHLRQLAKHGYIEEVPASGGRARWWRSVEKRATIADGPISAAETRKLLTELLARQAYALDRYLASGHRDRDWDDAAFCQSAPLRLTAPELAALRDRINQAISAFRRSGGDENAPPDAVPVSLLAVGFPLARENL